jgi:integrase
MAKRANGEGSIWRRKDGRYCASLLVKGKRRYVYAKTREEVAAQLTKLLKTEQDGAGMPEGRETVATFFAMWLDSIKYAIRLTTWTRYEQYVRLHLVPVLGSVRLTKLEPHHLQRLYKHRLDAGSSPTTVHHLHAVVHRGLRQAVRWNLAARNVAELVDPPRVRRHEMSVLDAEQARRFLDAARGSRLEALFVLAVSTGMREGELLALRWRDVDLSSARLSVTATVQRVRGKLRVGEPKTAKSRRRIALTAGAVEALQRHRAAQAEERLRAAEWADLDLVFPNRRGRHHEVSDLLKDEFRPVLERAGLPRMRFHDLRHTAATLMLARGVHAKVASEMLGHSTIGITLDLYSHVSEGMQSEAAQAIDGLLWG